MTVREQRRSISRRIRRAPVRRNVDETTFDEERDIVIGGDDKAQVNQ